MEKNQWRIARITDLHRNLDGVPTTATVLLPSKAVLTRTLRQIALLEPAYLELGNPTVPVAEEAPELPLPGQEEVRSDTGHAESSPSSGLDAVPVNRSRSVSSPCLETGEQGSASQYPEEGTSAVPESVPVNPEEASRSEIPPPPRRSTRERKRQGYYKLLSEGKL